MLLHWFQARSKPVASPARGQPDQRAGEFDRPEDPAWQAAPALISKSSLRERLDPTAIFERWHLGLMTVVPGSRSTSAPITPTPSSSTRRAQICRDFFEVSHTYRDLQCLILGPSDVANQWRWLSAGARSPFLATALPESRRPTSLHGKQGTTRTTKLWAVIARESTPSSVVLRPEPFDALNTHNGGVHQWRDTALLCPRHQVCSGLSRASMTMTKAHRMRSPSSLAQYPGDPPMLWGGI